MEGAWNALMLLLLQAIDFEILVMNQLDHWRFNKGQLMNIGLLEVRA